MKTSKAFGIPPEKVFQQAALSVSPESYRLLAVRWYFEWLIDDIIDPQVEHACEVALATHKKYKKARKKKGR